MSDYRFTLTLASEDSSVVITTGQPLQLVGMAEVYGEDLAVELESILSDEEYGTAEMREAFHLTGYRLVVEYHTPTPLGWVVVADTLDY